MRSDIVIAKCAHVSFQTLLLKPTKVTGMPTPNVAIHGAILTRGGPPELPGYEAA